MVSISSELMGSGAKTIVKSAKGPIGAFVPLRDNEAREAVATGIYLPEGIFADVAVFDDSEESATQKHFRYDTKRLKEIQGILSSTEVEKGKTLSLRSTMNELLLRQSTSQAVLVEACRKLHNERLHGTLTAANERLYSECIDAAQDELYPTYDPDIAQSSINKILRKAGTDNYVLTQYPFMVKREVDTIPTLSQELRDKWHAMLHERYDPALDAVRAEMQEQGLELSNATLITAARLFMKHVGLPLRDARTTYDSETNNGWDVVEDPDRSGWVNEPGTKTAYSGKRSQEITWDSFGRLMIHEVAFHDLRAENGSKTGYEAAQIGMPGSNDTEEGMAILLESLWAGKDPDALLGRDDFRYVAVAYAEGSLDERMHTEQEVYEFIDTVMKASGLARYDSKGLNAGALDHTRRAFRAMPEGKILRSNYAYRAGKVGAIRTLSSSEEEPGVFLTKRQRGKYNDQDLEQCEIMDVIAA